MNLIDWQKIIRLYDREEVAATVRSDGVQKVYFGLLYFGTGNENTVMIGIDEIYIDCIYAIQIDPMPK